MDDEYCCDWCGDFYQFSEHREDTDPAVAMSYCPEHADNDTTEEDS